MPDRNISPRAAACTAIAFALAFAPGDRVRGQSAAPITEVRVSPQDTSLSLDAKNYSTGTILWTYTWPDHRPANAILMKLDMPALPAGAVILDAKLHLRLVTSDRKADPAYAISVHKVIGKNPVISLATGQTTDGQEAWTANTCCYKNVPIAQGDLSPAYDTQSIDKTPGFKTWTVTSMVEQWFADPATNRGLVLNSDDLVRRDRFRYFASMEHADPSFRPFLAIKYSAGPIDTTPPSVMMSSPGGANVSGSVAVSAQASDNVGVVGVQFHLNGSPFGPELTSAPYSRAWDTTTISDGTYTLAAVARDSAGNSATSPAINAIVTNGIVRVQPQDTWLNINAGNYSGHPNLWAYTWPDHQPANTILMKFDIPALPTGARVDEATLHLALVDSDATVDATYTMTAHKVLGAVPVIAQATGYTTNGQNAWTPNGCCSNGVPLGQGDLSPAHDARAIDKSVGFKTWAIPAMVQEWVTDPSSNAGVIINPDLSAPRDHFRFFASMEYPDAALRPFLQIKYSVDATPPAISITAPAAGASLSGTVSIVATATDNVGVAGVQFKVDGVNLGPEDTAAPHTYTWNSSTVANGAHTLTAVARDSAGNITTSPSVVVSVANDVTAPAVAITAPTGGATISGATTIAAAASDNIGVAGVQFVVNGVNLGVEDTTSPYAVSWSTTTVPDGSHALTAVARDAAGNRTTSATVMVIVANVIAPPPPGGIAALYPGDVGIDAHPDVLFTEMFEQSTISNLTSRYTDVNNSAGMSFNASVPAGSTGTRSLQMTTNGSTNPAAGLYKTLPAGQEWYVRYYVNYNSSVQYGHSSVWLGGYNPSLSYPNPQAGIKPSGNDRFSTGVEPNSLDNDRWSPYTYWKDMRQANDGMYWGNLFLPSDTSLRLARNRWYCVEAMIKLNNPVTDSNGELAMWIDGVKTLHLGKGFPNGNWNGGVFTADPSSSPFGGLQWRSDSALNLNWIWLQNYVTGTASSIQFDHLVVAKSHVGCLASGSPDVTAPVISSIAASSITSSSSTIAWVTNESSDTQVEYGTTTGYGNLTALSTSLVTAHSQILSGLSASTVYHYRVRSRDAAGNIAVSPDGTFTTPAGPPVGLWPNRPSGFATTLSDQPWNALTGNGWNYLRRTASKDSDIRVDASTPFSPSNELRIIFTPDMQRDSEPGVSWVGLPRPTEIYSGWWMKVSPNWSCSPAGCGKITFLFPDSGNGTGLTYSNLAGTNGSYYINIATTWSSTGYRFWEPNVTKTPLAGDQWARVEWYVKWESSVGAGDGIIRWWVNGTLNGDYRNVPFPAIRGFVEYQHAPTLQNPPPAEQYMYIDHTHISLP